MRFLRVIPCLAFALAIIATPGPVAAQADPEPPTSKITYRQQIGPGEASRLVAIKTLGTQPTSATTLVDSTGRLTVLATPVMAGHCQNKGALSTGLGDEIWCIKLTGIRAGASAVGSLAGTASTVELTVEAKHHWGNAFWWTVLVLVVAALLVYLTTAKLPKLIVAFQYNSTAQDHAEVPGVKEWAEAGLRNRLTKAEVVSRLTWAIDHGAVRVRGIRQTLNDMLADDVLDGAPLRDQVRVEAELAQAVNIDQILTPSGEVAISRAASLLDTFSSAVATHKEFDDLSKRMMGQLTGEELETAERLRTAGLEQHEDYLTMGTKRAWEELLGSYLESISNLRSGSSPADSGWAMVATSAPSVWVNRSGRATDSASIVLATYGVSAVVIATAALLMLVAATTVLAGTYLPNSTFGTFSDYLTLTVAGLGSAGVTGVVTLVLLLRPPNGWHA